jgi:hypothetical protein
MVATESREEAFFGGWQVRPVSGGSNKWGPPQWRVQEFVADDTSDVVMPPASPWLQLGVPYYVLNSQDSTHSISVKRPSDGATLGGLGPGYAAVAIPSVDGRWVWIDLLQFEVGTPYPALRYLVEITTNTANFDLLQAVMAQGYDGTEPAAVTCRVRGGVAVGARAVLAPTVESSWTTGNTFGSVSWASGSFAVLLVDNGAEIGGRGGVGGRGGIAGTGSANGRPGEPGGRAVRAEIPLFVDCQGSIWGGGGGGGGGGSAIVTATVIGGGGGGGRGMTMAPNGALLGVDGGITVAPAEAGTAGGAFSAGGGGLGANGGGNGGAGAFAAAAGSSGTGVPSTSIGGAGGAAGAAISYLPAAGAPTILGGGGNILGATLSEAT